MVVSNVTLNANSIYSGKSDKSFCDLIKMNPLFPNDSELMKPQRKVVFNPDGTYTVITQPGPGVCGGERVEKTYTMDGKLKEVMTSPIGTKDDIRKVKTYKDDGTIVLEEYVNGELKKKRIIFDPIRNIAA